MTEAVQFTGSIAFHGEGPFWDARNGSLVSVDLLAGDVLVLGESGALVRHHLGSVAAAARPRSGGGFIVALEHGVVLTDAQFGVEESIDGMLADPAVRFNDGGCDPRGRFYIGTMAYDETPGAGVLLRVDGDRSVHPVLDGVTISNGLQFTPAGDRVFYNDTPTGRIDQFDVDVEAGTFHDRRTFATVDAAQGSPDGMAIDAEGGVWIALWGGSAVHRYDANGALSDVIDLPVTNVTACAFGGDDLRTLYITTSRVGLAAGENPAAGAVFAAAPGVAGAALFDYAG